MKKIIKFTFCTVLIFTFYSCRTVEYTPSIYLNSKLPALKVDFDWLSIETNYSDGTFINTGTSTATADGRIYTTNESQYIKNPTIKWVRDRLTSDSYNICEKFGPTYGKVVWSVNKHFVNNSLGLNLLCIVSGFPFLGIPSLLGLPRDKFTGVADISVSIYNKNNDLIATYSSYKVVKSYNALWWGYKLSDARKRSYNNAFTEAVNDITTQINRDSSHLKNKLISQ